MVTNLQVQVKTLLYDLVHTDWNISERFTEYIS